NAHGVIKQNNLGKLCELVPLVIHIDERPSPNVGHAAHRLHIRRGHRAERWTRNFGGNLRNGDLRLLCAGYLNEAGHSANQGQADRIGVSFHGEPLVLLRVGHPQGQSITAQYSWSGPCTAANVTPLTSELGLRCVKTPALAADVETFWRNCIFESRRYCTPLGSMP